jgi:hypothetical protein
MAAHDPANLADALSNLPPKAKTPNSARVLNTWITQAQAQLDTAGAQLGWLVAATVIAAALQRAVDEAGNALFLLKGGTMLQYRLPGPSRTTQDIDGLVRGNMDRFIAELDKTLGEPWGPLTLVRGEVHVIEVPNKIIKPRRFDILVQLGGITWRRVQIEISPDEGHAGEHPEHIPAPSLAGFGLPSPDSLVSLSMAYQIAQKTHAVSDPHDPPNYINDRARDVIDLLLLRDLITTTGAPVPVEVRAAIEDVFTARAVEAEATGATPRYWPTTLTAHEHWTPSFTKAADTAGLALNLTDAVEQVNTWLQQIETENSLAKASYSVAHRTSHERER